MDIHELISIERFIAINTDRDVLARGRRGQDPGGWVERRLVRVRRGVALAALLRSYAGSRGSGGGRRAAGRRSARR